MNEIKKGYVPNEVYKVEQFGNTFKLIDTAGVKVGTLGATTGVRKGAFKEGKAVQAFIDKNGTRRSHFKVRMRSLQFSFFEKQNNFLNIINFL